MEYAILILFTIACAYFSFNAGVKDGAARTVDKLHEAKIICYDNKGNIRPNPFFDA